jgi:hypothetical protein
MSKDISYQSNTLIEYLDLIQIISWQNKTFSDCLYQGMIQK